MLKTKHYLNDRWRTASIPQPSLWPAPIMTTHTPITNFFRVSHMNHMFGNPKGDPKEINMDRLLKQVNNIPGEYSEFLTALTAGDVPQMRDALCDIMVFAYGAFHFMGYDADADMATVVEAVMTRFCKNREDLEDTVTKYVRLGFPPEVLRVEGEFPYKCVKVAADFTAPDGEYFPKGKFLKSASYKQPVLLPIE